MAIYNELIQALYDKEMEKRLYPTDVVEFSHIRLGINKYHELNAYAKESGYWDYINISKNEPSFNGIKILIDYKNKDIIEVR